MGVNTLLKHLGPCLEDSHVERFRGKTVALDGNTFIFRGCYSCSEQVRLVIPVWKNRMFPLLLAKIQIQKIQIRRSVVFGVDTKNNGRSA